MKTKKAADIIFAVFFTVMLLLTLFADDLYRLTLPKVAVEKVMRRAFPVEVTGPNGENYESWRTVPAISKEALHEGRVYVVIEKEEGLFLAEYFVSTGEEKDGIVEITGGVVTGTPVVIGSDRNYTAGQQVLVSEWNESLALHTARERGEDIGSYAADMRKCLKNDILYVIGAVVASVGVALLCCKFCKGRWHPLKVPVLIVWCILVGLFFKATILLPGEWIPEKLIDWAGWRMNIERYPF